MITTEVNYPAISGGKFNGTYNHIDLSQFYSTKESPSVSTLSNLTSAYLEISSASKVIVDHQNVFMQIKQ